MSDGPAVVIADQAGANIAKVTAAGQLQVAQSPPTAPPGTTPVNVAEVDDIMTSTTDTFTIPSGKTMHIQRFAAGASGGPTGNKQSKVSLWYAPAGTLDGSETLIRLAYLSGSNEDYAIQWEAPAVGDGTIAIVMVRERLDAGLVEMAGFWDGYHD